MISKILDFAKQSGGPVQVKYSAAESQLCLFKIDSVKMLPDDLHAKWNSTTETRGLAPHKSPGMTSDGKDT